MHAFDHLVVEALSAPVEGVDQAPRALDLGRAWRKGLVARLDLVGMDQTLAVEAKSPPRVGLAGESRRVVEAVEYAVECRNTGRARSEDNHLERGRNRLAVGIER